MWKISYNEWELPTIIIVLLSNLFMLQVGDIIIKGYKIIQCN